MSYGLEYGAVLPVDNQSGQTALYLQQQNERRRQEYLQQQKLAQAHQSALMEYVNQNLNWKDLMTGTNADPLYHQNFNNAKDALTKKIIDNPDMSTADLGFITNGYVSKLSDFSDRAKRARANVEEYVKQYNKDGSIDADSLKKHALTKALFTVDPNTGKPVLNENLDPDTNWGKQIMDERPELVVKGNGDLSQTLKNLHLNDYKNESTYDHRGVQLTTAREGKYNPLIHSLVDAKGNDITSQYMAGKPVNATGVQVKVDDNTLKQFTSNEGGRAYLRGTVRQSYGLDPDSKEGVEKQKEVLKGFLQSNNPGFINQTKQDRKEDGWLARAQMGLLWKALDKSKEEAPNPLLDAMKAWGGDRSYTSPETIKVKGQEINALKINPGSSVKGPNGEQYDAMYINPENGRLIVKYRKTEQMKQPAYGKDGHVKTNPDGSIIYAQTGNKAYVTKPEEVTHWRFVRPDEANSFFMEHVYSNGLKGKQEAGAVEESKHITPAQNVQQNIQTHSKNDPLGLGL